MSYITKQLLKMLLAMLAVTFLTFLAFELIPGDPAQIILGIKVTPIRLELMRHELGLDRPFFIRYFKWLLGMFTGNLGISYIYCQPVYNLIADKFEVTMCICMMSFTIIILFSIPLGIIFGYLGDRAIKFIHSLFNQLFMAIPTFFVGIIVSWCFGVLLHMFVPSSFPDIHKNFPLALKYIFFAAVSLSIPKIAMTVRMMQEIVSDELRKDYILSSISHGCSMYRILVGHVLKNSIVSIVPFLGQVMAEILGGTIIIEQVFGIPGLGRFFVTSISNRDYPVVQAIIIIFVFWVVLSGTLADIISKFIDPRLRVLR